MRIAERQRIERRIVKAVVRAALEAGYTISLDNGGDDWELRKETNRVKIFRELFATDSERIYLRDPSGRLPSGGVAFVYGNDGWDVIADFSPSLDELLAPIFRLCNKLEDQYGSIMR